MSDAMIEVHGLGKRYQIGARTPNVDSLRDSISLAAKRILSSVGLRPRAEVGSVRSQEFWALRDVSFEVPRGAVVGIVGANGAGKSTLLKLLSRITDPSEGYARIRGRVGALLEVGTGFHRELTGRENVFLSGAILGMRRAEIARKFDEIVEFAGLSRFIDTPVKRYSSGMTVRLGFAVAAHLEPEVLIVDEVLAVGDTAFRRKSTAKMLQVATGGRTVLVVSHNMDIVRRLASRCILLDGGRVLVDGPTDAVIEEYVSRTGVASGGAAQDSMKHTDRDAAIGRVRLLDEAGAAQVAVLGGEMTVEVQYEQLRAGHVLELYVEVYTMEGQPVYQFRTSRDFIVLPAERGRVTVELRVPRVRLYPGYYWVRAYLADDGGVCHSLIDPALRLEVVIGEQSGHIGRLSTKRGLLLEDADWVVR